MTENDSTLYEAFKAKDTRFDGRFFVGISSTKIYCRPVCWAKQAKKENCTFFSSAAAAEQAGYRPCLLCRPELAPGASVIDASSALARKAAKLIEESCGVNQSLELLARKLGCTSRHLRRVFMEEYHVTPIQYLQTCRLLLAKNLLTDTRLSVLEVAMAAGFGSLRRLNDLFQKHYHLSPTALRKSLAAGNIRTSEITVQLGYHPPYRWKEILKFLSQRAISGVEKITSEKYMRTVRLLDKNGAWCSGWISVGDNPKKYTICVTFSDTLVPVLSQVLTRVKRLFDLYCEPEIVYQTLQTLNELKPGICVPGLRVPGCFDAFETAVRAILGQQITVKAASTLAGRIASTYGTSIETGIEGLTHTFPHPEDIVSLENVVEEALGKLGVTAARSKCIFALAKALENGEIELDGCMNPETEMKKLMKIKGIGSWTANYIAMRAMEWPDAFLETDIGIKHALPGYTPKELLAMSEKWKPWRSYATMNLWNSL
ncbi:MAG: helix-turn-helix domain-containing protein [Oscillospiraceae bacterium]|nr:helix-turn-helix domain-containing protein [Oscillospiraceae bacterium]